MSDRLLTARELADQLGLTPATVVRWTRHGRLPGYRLGRALRYRPDDVAAWLEQQATAGGATRGVSPAPDATRRDDAIVPRSPALLRNVAARTEEEPDAS